eukprot:276966_1
MAEPSLTNSNDSGSTTSDLPHPNSLPTSDESKTSHIAGVASPTQYFRQQYVNNTGSQDVFNYMSITPSQLQLLLLTSNDLEQKRLSNRLIDQRLIKDQKEFENIEVILNTKIRKYQHFIKRKLQNVDYIENIDFDHMDDLLDEIIEIDDESSKLRKEFRKRKEIRKKKEDENQNEIYRMIGLNNELLNTIDAMTHKIDYWQQLLLVTSPKCIKHQSKIHHSQINNIDNNVTPHAIEDVLKIRSENQKILNDLRGKLGELRARKVQ